ncbi:MAG TPA: alpha/beta fold hydrolase BchO [Acetobacteraceae bacterium]
MSRPGADWPNRAASRTVRAAGLEWHVQVAGSGPVLLLVHGTGAATHSWRGMLPLLAQHFTVVAPDLPGHGFTQAPAAARLSLPGMAHSLHGLLTMMNLRPVAAVGHSAGAAILARMALDRTLALRALVSLNGAFIPLQGVAGQIFSPLARVLVGLPGLPQVFAWRARNPAVVEQLLAATGSTLDAEGVRWYGEVVRRPDHAASALGMMAHWDLRPLLSDLPRLGIALLLITGEGDRTVPPSQSADVQRLVPGAALATLPGLGHLAHEERPEEVAALIEAFMRQYGLPP